MTVAVRPATADDAPGLTACIDAAYAPFVTKGLDLPPVSEGIAGGQWLGQARIATATSAARAAGYDRLHLATHIEMTGTQGFYLQLG